MPLFSSMHRQQQELPPMQQSRAYGQYIDSNPSSTHSSPRSFVPDLEPYYPTSSSHVLHSQTYPIPAGIHANPYPPAQQRRPNHHLQVSRSNSYSSYNSPMSLQVSTSTSSVQEHDPNERTARPGNAHAHAQFHSSLSAHLAPLASAASSSTAPSASTNSDIARANPEGDNADTSGGPPTDYTSSTPGLSAGLTRPLQPIEQERLAHLDRLKFFLATAPSRWDSAASNAAPPGSNGGDLSTAFASGSSPFSGISGLGIEPAYHHAPPHPSLNRFLLPNQEFVTCVLWNGLYHITGTDIVRALVFRFEAFGRPVRNMKKFEEGVFSDLRNLKPGVDACLEEPKSPFLDLLFKYQCIRTQKKQKVFYWFSVPHDRLFLDALERDLKREKMGQEPTSQIVGEPALSFSYDSKRSLYEQFSKAQGAREGEGELEAAVRRAEEGDAGDISESGDGGDSSMADDSASDADDAMAGDDDGGARRKHPAVGPNGQQVFQLFSLFEGSPTYKQRRKKSAKSSGLRRGSEDHPDDYGRGRNMLGASSGRYSSASHSRERSNLSMNMSMMDDFGANGQEHQGETLSAAETFMRQARGETVPPDGIVRKHKPQPIVGEVGAYYNEAADGHQRFAMGAGHSRGRSFDGSTGQAPQDPGSSTQPAGYNTTFADSQAQGQVGQGQKFTGPSPTATGMAQYEAISADGKVRVFVCPLFSCGRLFKRMEHLKRHLRTHTMERPFSCPQCKKRFSRSDNLSQHLRTHERVGSGSMSSGVSGASPEGWMDGGDEGDASGEASANESSGHGSVGDSEDDEGMMQGLHSFGGNIGEIGMFGSANGLSMSGMDLSSYGINLDARACEIELPGGVRDVQGDEEGLLMRTEGGFDSSMAYHQQSAQISASEGYFSSLPTTANSGLLFSGIPGTSASTDYTDPQWSARTQPTRPSATGSPSGFMRNMQPHQSHSSSSSASSAYGDDYPVPSLSAPSHKQTFDHPGLYPHDMLENMTNTNPSNVGPVRRHRSMTPSLVRNGEPIRRPVTAGSNDFQGGGSPGSIASIGSSGAGPRGYHPYAYSASNSRAGSTANSPLAHPIPLTGEYSQQGRRSDSRGSNYSGVGVLHEPMRNMMSMNMDPDSHASVASNVFNDGVFRSDSPASFQQSESPAPFSVDLPMQYTGTASYIPPTAQHQQHQIHAASLPVQATPTYESTSHQQHYDPYYPQPHSTI